MTGELDVVLTRISPEGIWYRGHDVTKLARERSVEEVASLLWTGAFDTDIFDTPLHVISGGAGGSDLPFLSRAQSVLPLVAASDPLAADLEPRAAAETGWRILNLLASVAADSQELEETVEETLARAWTRRSEATPFIRSALILCADGGMNAVTRTARCVADSRANPYAVATAALAAMTGDGYRGELAGAASPFVDRDPRAALLLEMLAEGTAAAPASSSLEYALVAMSRAFELPDEAPVTIFAIGRMIGCIAHAIDEYDARSS